jgi:cell division protease FtsH
MISKDINEYVDNLVSYHEAGHTITALLFRDFFDVRKVTITANSNGAGGYTLFTPKEKFNSYATKKYLLANLIVTMGGRAAEKILFNKIQLDYVKKNYSDTLLFNNMDDLDVTSGASADLKQADQLARKYIELFGYTKIDNSSKLTKIIQTPRIPYLSLSEETKTEIDDSINKLINFGLITAIKIIEKNLDSFNKLATDLIHNRSVDLKYLNELPVSYF